MTAPSTSPTDAGRVSSGAVSQQLAAVLATDQQPHRPSPAAAAVAFSWRALLKIKYVPEQLFDVTAFPIIMTLMFTYLFGGAIAGSTSDYLQFLLPGIMVMNVVMTTMYTGQAVKQDIDKGVFDRFRTLPMWRPAPMVGYLAADAVRYTVGAVVVVVLGLLLGFRPPAGISGVAAGVALVVVFAFALSWVWTLVGLIARSEKSATSLSMLTLFPLTFVSNVFVELDTLPGWMRPVVEHNPITHLVTAVRSMMAAAPDAGAIAWATVWCAGLITVFGALTMRQYNRR